MVIDERANALVECRVAKKSAEDAVQALLEYVDTCMADVAAMHTANRSLTAQKSELIGEIGQIRHRARELQTSLDRHVVPQTYSNATLNGLESVRAELEGLEQAGEHSIERVAAIVERALALGAADTRMTAVRVDARRVATTLQRNHCLLTSWMPEEHTTSQQRISASLRRIEKAARATKNTSAEEVSAELTAIEADLEQLNRGLEAAVLEAHRLRNASEQQRYIVTAIIDVCEQLGFEKIAETAEIEPGSQHGALVLQFDTLNKGMVVFKVGLEGDVHTESAIQDSYCATEFGRLTEALEDAYGIGATFAPQQAAARPTLLPGVAKVTALEKERTE